MLSTSQVAEFALMLVLVVLWVATLGHISRRQFVHPKLKTVWFLFVLLGAWAGMLLYWLIGRNDGRLPAPSATNPESLKDSAGPIVLTRVPTELLASLLVGRLQNEGIRAEMSGVLTSAFRAEAPGGVQILIARQDEERSRALLASWDKARN
jgi:hypothetical protein